MNMTIGLECILMQAFSQSAVGFEHQSELSKHASQTDAAKGFGGKYGLQKDRVDKVNQSLSGYYETLFRKT